MNLSKFYIDNPTIVETKVGNDTGDTAAIVTGASTQKALNVVVDGGSVSSTSSGVPAFDSTTNLYSAALVPFATVTTILSYTVPANTNLYITSIVGWGDTSGEFLLLVDGIVKGGGRTTAAIPTVEPDFTDAPILATAEQLVTITAEHYVTASHYMKANLLGGVKNV